MVADSKDEFNVEQCEMPEKPVDMELDDDLPSIDDLADDSLVGITIVRKKSILQRLFSSSRGDDEHIPDDCKGDSEDKRWFRSTYKQAMNGDKDCKNILGVCYETGYSRVALSTKKSARWFMEAATEGSASAMNNMALMYLSGHRGRCKKDLEKALYWFGEANDKGSPHAAFHLGLIYLTDPNVSNVKAFKMFKIAGKRGVGHAMNNVGIMYLTGDGCVRNLKKAKKWFEKAMSCGVAEAEHNLGMMYNLGIYVRQDLRKSNLLFDQSTMMSEIFDLIRKPLHEDRQREAMKQNQFLICGTHQMSDWSILF